MLHLWSKFSCNWTWTFKMRHIIKWLDLCSLLTFDIINISRYPCCTYDPSLVAIGPELSNQDTFCGCLTFYLSMWYLISWTCEGTHVAHVTQVWLQLDLNCQNETHFQVTWPSNSYVTFDLTKIWRYLINIWRYPCYTYDPSLVAIGPELSKWDTL